MTEGIFKDKLFALELGLSVPFKQKSGLSKLITDNGGKVAFMINKKTSYLLATEDIIKKSYSSKLAAATKNGIPVLLVDYIQDCVEASTLLSDKPYLIQSGSGAVVGGKEEGLNTIKVAPKKKAAPRVVPSVHVWTYKSVEPGAPEWPEDNYDIAKEDVLQKGSTFFAIELHVAQIHKLRKFRVFTHRGHVDQLDDDPVGGVKECRYVQNVEEAEAIYSSLYNTMASQAYNKVSLLSSSKIGSDMALVNGNRTSQGPSSLPPQSRDL